MLLGSLGMVCQFSRNCVDPIWPQCTHATMMSTIIVRTYNISISKRSLSRVKRPTHMIQQHHKGYARTFPHTAQADCSKDAQDDERGDKGRERQRHFALDVGDGGGGGDDGCCGVVEEK